MARLNFVKAAAKDYPSEGIKKGESYYWWQPYRQGKRYSKERPKPSQVETNECISQVLALIEGLEEWQGEWTEDDRDELVSSLESIRDEEQEKFDNMPEGFQMGDVGAQIEERIQLIDEWIGELQGIEFDEHNEDTPLEYALSTAVTF